MDPREPTPAPPCDECPVPNPTESLAREFLDEMRAIRRAVRPPAQSVCGHDLRLEDVGRGCAGVLDALAAKGGRANPSLLTRELGLSPARVSNILGTLEAEGLVERGPGAGDRRRVEVRLTDRGRELDRRMSEGLTRSCAGLLAQIGEDDARELVRIMGRITRVLEAREKTEGREGA